MVGDGLDQPATDGTGYDAQDLPNQEATRVMPADLESGSYLVLAHPDNSGIIYIGWDDDVDDSNGTPLSANTGVSIDLDNEAQNLFAYADTGGDTISFLATN